MMYPVSVLFGAAFTVAVCLALGKLLFRALKLSFHRGEDYALSLPAGAACLSGLVTLLTALHAARPAVFLALGILILAIAFRTGALKPDAGSLPALPRGWRTAALIVAAPCTILYFFNALAPEISPDGSSYHLGMVALYFRAHGFVPVATNMYAHLSQGFEMLFLFAYAFGRHSAAAMVHFAFLLDLAALMVLFGRRFAAPVAATCGALFVYLCPVVGIDGISAYNDVAVATCLFAIFYLLEVWEQERHPGLLVAIGLLAGFGYAIKYTAFLALPYAMGFIAWKQWRARKPVLRALGVVAATALVLVLPWLMKNWLYTGNPLAPFFNRWFENPYIHISFEDSYRYQMRHYPGLGSWWTIPQEVTYRGGALQGLLGPLFLLSPIALFALSDRRGRRWLLAALIYALPYSSNFGTRFLIPSLPFVSIAMALAFLRVKYLAPALVLAHAVLSWPQVVPRYSSPYAWRLVHMPWKAALGIQKKEAFLEAESPGYVLARLIDERVPPGAKVFGFSGPAMAYGTREFLVFYEGALNNVAEEILWSPVHGGWIPVGRLRLRFPQQELDAVRVVYSGAPSSEDWGVNELRVFSGEQELPRHPDWRLRARPNPWDVQHAFDNSPLTRWRSWQPAKQGMFVEVDFAGASLVDSVLLECSRDQEGVPLRLEGREPGGQWRKLSDEPERFEVKPRGGMRRAATRELKALGIDYILITPDDDFARQVQAPEQWGLTLVGEKNGAKLFRIE